MNGNEKKPVKKPLIFYYLIVLVVLMLLNWLIVPSVMERSIQKTSYREFLDSWKAMSSIIRWKKTAR